MSNPKKFKTTVSFDVTMLLTDKFFENTRKYSDTNPFELRGAEYMTDDEIGSIFIKLLAKSMKDEPLRAMNSEPDYVRVRMSPARFSKEK